MSKPGFLDRFREIAAELSPDEIELIDDNIVKSAFRCAKENPNITLDELKDCVSVKMNEEVNRQTLYYRIRKFIVDYDSIATKPKETKPKEGKKVKRTDVIKTLNQEYAEIVAKVTEKTKWFTDALVNIGFQAMLAAFQFARIEPKDFMKKVEEFKDAEEFSSFVLRYLDAMLKYSAEGAQELVACNEELRKKEALLDYCVAVSDELMDKLKKAVTYWRAAISSMDEASLRRYLVAVGMAEFATAMVSPSQESKEFTLGVNQ